MHPSEARRYSSVEIELNSWFDHVKNPFQEIAEYKAKRNKIPVRLDRIYHGSGDIFSKALQSTDKAKASLENQPDAIMAMRNFLQSFWGNLINFGKQRKSSIWQGFQKRKLSQADVREKLSKSLSHTSNEERKLVEALNNMSELHNEMSDSGIGKNLSFNDIEYFRLLVTRWILVISDIIDLINVDIE